MRGASGGSAIVVHRTLTTHANENNGGWHYHPGYVYNVVKSGTIAVQDGCDAEARLYGAGEAFEPPKAASTAPSFPMSPERTRAKKTPSRRTCSSCPRLSQHGGQADLGRNVPDTMGHCGPPSAVDHCRKGGWQKFDFPQKFAGENACAAWVAARPRITLMLPIDPLK